MKKMKKVLAMLLTLAMVMGMSLTTFAEDTMPSASDEAVITVNGVEKDARVVAYKLVEANYDNGFTGYSIVDANDDKMPDYDIDDIYNVTANEATAIARQIRGTEGLALVPQTDGSYKLTTAAGLYLILVYDTVDKVYNPMIVSLGYDTNKSGTSNQLQNGTVDAEGDYTYKASDLTNTIAYAKSTPITITKTADQETVYVGEEVNYTVETTVPDYSAAYSNVVYKIKDTLVGLNLVTNSIEVYVVTEEGNVLVDASNYTGEENATAAGFEIVFTNNWIMTNGGKEIVVKYKATATAQNGDTKLVNNAALTNDVKVSYTNEPDVDKDPITKEDIEKIYTFEINGEILKYDNNYDKDATAEENKAHLLSGAEFTLTNSNGETTTYTTKADGVIYFTGLDVGTYTLVETKAPAGYALNNMVYTVVIDANVGSDDDSEELVNWTITITDEAGNVATFNNTPENESTADALPVINTKLSALPSTGGIGTAVFTIAGCAIMVAAAYFFLASRKKKS